MREHVQNRGRVTVVSGQGSRGATPHGEGRSRDRDRGHAWANAAHEAIATLEGETAGVVIPWGVRQRWDGRSCTYQQVYQRLADR